MQKQDTMVNTQTALPARLYTCTVRPYRAVRMRGACFLLRHELKIELQNCGVGLHTVKLSGTKLRTFLPLVLGGIIENQNSDFVIAYLHDVVRILIFDRMTEF